MAMILASAGGIAAADTGDVIVEFMHPNTVTMGSDVAIDGNYVLLSGLTQGIMKLVGDSAYLFDISNPSSPVLHQTYVNPSPSADRQNFGLSLDVSGDRVVITESGTASAGSDGGIVWEFDRDTGAQVSSYVDPSNLNTFDETNFGTGIAVNGDYIFVGNTTRAENGSTFGSGGAALWFDVASPAQNAIYFDTTDSIDEDFGYAVDFSQSHLVVGIRYGNTNGNLFNTNGAVRIIDRSTGSTENIGLSNGADFELFGHAVAVNSLGQVVVGAPGSNSNQGAAYVYDTGTSTMTQLVFPDLHSNAFCGHSVAITDQHIIVSAPDNRGMNPDGSLAPGSSGSVYIFDASTLALVAQVNGDSIGEQLGHAVDATDTVVVVGKGQRVGAGGTGSFEAMLIELDPSCNAADFAAPYGQLDFRDVSAFNGAFNTMDPSADLNNDGLYNFFDVSAFLTAYDAGCP